MAHFFLPGLVVLRYLRVTERGPRLVSGSSAALQSKRSLLGALIEMTFLHRFLVVIEAIGSEAIDIGSSRNLEIGSKCDVSDNRQGV
jgi:hypothetical protein